jgi:hypothetical protein
LDEEEEGSAEKDGDPEEWQHGGESIKGACSG